MSGWPDELSRWLSDAIHRPSELWSMRKSLFVTACRIWIGHLRRRRVRCQLQCRIHEVRKSGVLPEEIMGFRRRNNPRVFPEER